MANRYLRATGNWNGPVWAATSGGAAGSASTPTADDSVHITSNFTVTLTANATCYMLYTSSGRINMAGYKITTELEFTMQSTLDMGGGTVEVTNGEDFPVSYAGTVLNPGLTKVTASNLLSGGGDITFGNGSYGDFQLNLGIGAGGAVYNITGSPTFRSLIIQSKNSAAHTVNFDALGHINVNKFIAIGSSSSNRLHIAGGVSDDGGYNMTTLTTGYVPSTFYAQYINMTDFDLSEYYYAPVVDAKVQMYAGTGSTGSNLDGNYLLLQDPPKISTLVDPLTTAPGSNPNWTVTGTVTKVTTGHDGGGYSLSSGAKLTSTDTFDLLSSTLSFQTIASSSLKFNIWGYSHSLTANKFYRLSLSGTTYLLQNSDDGASWSTVTSNTVDPNSYRSLRLEFEGAGTIGSINPSLTPPNTGAFLEFF